MQTRDAKPEPTTTLERLLASGNNDLHQEIAQLLWDADSADEAVGRMGELADARLADGSLERLGGRIDTGGWG